MPHYSVATTKDKLSSLIDKALAGEEVVITNRGRPVVRIVAETTEGTVPRDVAGATDRLRTRLAGKPSLAIPVHHFREWLYGDEDY